ncbi:hypothetical protein [Rhodovarius sp.]|uniref:hypothetical protein n=1 Tax=Rhodovarius sp. TaxID=2972673 RepID=UPI003341CEA0
MLAPDTRQNRRCQAGKPVIELSEFPEPLLNEVDLPAQTALLSVGEEGGLAAAVQFHA